MTGSWGGRQGGRTHRASCGEIIATHRQDDEDHHKRQPALKSEARHGGLVGHAAREAQHVEERVLLGRIVPHAQAAEGRAQRRSQEVTDLDYQTVAAAIARRDALDQGRETGPLAQADDAVVVDTSNKGVDEIVAEIKASLA